MATRRSARPFVAIAAGVLLLLPLDARPAAGPMLKVDGVGAVIATYQSKIPELMADEHIPGLALALVDGDRVVWQQGFGSTHRGGG